MNEVQLFNSDVFGSLRVITIEDEPWFVGNDVATILGYRDVNQVLLNNVEEEDRKYLKFKAFSVKTEANNSNNLRELLWNKPNDFSDKCLINESGIYSLIIRSKLKSAKQFQRYVTSEVLPAIRKHGAYMTPELIEQVITSPDFIIQLATKLKEETAAKNKALEVIEVQKPKVKYYDEVLDSKDGYTMTTIAKSFGTDAVRLNAYLKSKGVQYKQDSIWVLYQKYENCGYTQTKTYSANGSHMITTVWTQKGREFIYKLLKEDNLLDDNGRIKGVLVVHEPLRPRRKQAEIIEKFKS